MSSIVSQLKEEILKYESRETDNTNEAVLPNIPVDSEVATNTCNSLGSENVGDSGAGTNLLSPGFLAIQSLTEIWYLSSDSV